MTPPVRDVAARSGPAVLRVVTGPVALRRWAVAALVANIGIIVTGALVRLTGSGLGCPTWPRCTTESYTTHPALGLHGAIEFGNRLLTFVLLIVALGTLVTAVRTVLGARAGGTLLTRPASLLVLAAVGLFGIPFQGVVGGITVLTKLNPFVVAVHLLLSFTLVVLSTVLVRRSYGLERRPVGALRFWLARATFVVAGVTVWLGTVVTGSGPHAGDENARRTGFDPATVTHLHAAAVYVLVALTVACVVLLRSRAVVWLLLVELLQGGIGFAQYFNGLPILLVMLHLLGAALLMAAAANVTFGLGRVGAQVSANR